MKATNTQGRRAAHWRSLLFATAFSIALAPAGSSPATPETPPYARSETIAYTARPGNLLDMVQTIEIAVNTDAAARQHSEQRFRANAYFDDLRIVEAATLKADGRRLDVPPEAIAIRAAPASPGDASLKVDERLVSIAFPGLAPGDRIRYALAFTARREATPGGVGLTLAPDPSDRYAAYAVTLDAPQDLRLETAAKGFAYRAENRDGRSLHQWTLNGLPYLAPEQGSVDQRDVGPYLSVSTFPSWDAAANAFCGRAAPLAAVTPEIARLAGEIVHGRSGVREEAEAIYDWVSANIRYVSVILGSGGLTPNPAASVAANRYGDCKDHATLTRALLAARGVASEYALINAGSPAYRTPAAPALSAFDHVIVHIPELNLYADPTLKDGGLGLLPASLHGKPTLRCGNGRPSLARVPTPPADAQAVSVTADVAIAADGAATGEAAISAKGSPTLALKSATAWARDEGARTSLARLMQAAGVRGSAELVESSFDAATGASAAKMKFALADGMLGREKPWPVVAGPELFAKPFLAYGQLFDAARARDFVCRPSVYSETVTYRPPSGWTPAGLPKNIDLKSGPAEFAARYDWSDGALKVERRFAMRTSDPVCPAAMAAELAPAIDAAIRDSNRRLAFVAPEGAPAPDAPPPAPSAGADGSPAAASHPSRPNSLSFHATATVRAFNQVDFIETTEILAETDQGARLASTQTVDLDDFHDVTVLEAATLKADGRRLAVPADKIFTRSFDDGWIENVILFPDVARGDRVRTVVSRKQTRARTPGGFSFASRILQDRQPSRLSLTLDAPAGLKLHIASAGGARKTSEKNGRVVHEWEFAADRRRHPDWRYPDWDELYVPRAVAFFEVSSYPGWKEAGQDYCGPAEAAAAVTPEIARLAGEIAAGRPSRREQAQAVLDWLTANMAPDGASLARTALAPSAAEATLARRKGTQNDVAALMRALLAARGVEAFYALTEADDGVSHTGRVPGLGFSRVLLWLPEFGVYADPSNKGSALGGLSDDLFGRPALRCGPGGAALTLLPPPQPGAASVAVRAEIAVSGAGAASGVTTISAQGAGAAALGQSMAELGKEGPAAALTESLRRQGLRGAAQAEPLQTDGGGGAALKLTFAIDENLLAPDEPREAIAGPLPASRPYLAYARTLRPGRSGPFRCAPADYRETIVYRLPPGWRPRELPADIDVNGGPASFTARYRFEGGSLKIERAFAMRTDGAPCPAELAADVARVAVAAERDSETRLAFMAETRGRL